MLKNTKTRTLIKELLEHSHEPLNANEIFDKLKSENITISSIYRTLDTFYSNNILTKDIDANGVNIYTIKNDEHKHYLECKKCHKSTELDFCPYTNINKKIKNQTDFVVDEHNLVIYGVCKDCNNHDK